MELFVVELELTFWVRIAEDPLPSVMCKYHCSIWYAL